MSGKRKWSAAGAVAAMHRAYSGWDPTDPSVPIDTAHLARAYLAGIKAALPYEAAGCAPQFFAAEQARLNKRASKRGKAKL